MTTNISEVAKAHRSAMSLAFEACQQKNIGDKIEMLEASVPLEELAIELVGDLEPSASILKESLAEIRLELEAAKADCTLVGWISGNESDAESLREIGIVLGKPTNDGWEDCVVSRDAFLRLEPLWGKHVWGLAPMKRPVESEGDA